MLGVRCSVVAGSAPSVVEAPQIEETDRGTRGDGWMVVVYNNETNTYDEVTMVLMLATGCGAEEAYIETWEIDHFGKSNVHFAGENECRDAAAIIGRIGIKVEVAKEA